MRENYQTPKEVSILNETIKGNIGVSIDGGWFGYLFFTSDSLIVARTEQKRYSPEHMGPLTRMILHRVHGKKIEEEKNRERMYMTAHPDNILAADKKNFAIPFSCIDRIEMKKPGRVLAGKILISTNTREKPYKYPLREGSVPFDEYVSLLRSLMPSKLSLS
jgi:hypothetical protein